MGLTSLQVSMDTSEWLQGAVNEESGIDSSPPSGDMITCSRPMLERKLRPQPDQALKCPRCDSTHTKFCYYNNYSLSQPRYFCKTCRRYWTKGGTLRNIPVGGGCRKNKRVSVRKSNDDHQPLNHHHHHHHLNSLSLDADADATDLHLSYPDVQLSHFTNLLGNHGDIGHDNFLENSRQVDFMERKFDTILGNPRNHDFMGNNDLGLVGGLGHGFTSNSHGLCSPYGISLNWENGTSMDTCQRLMLPFKANEEPNAFELKPNKQILSLDWQDQGCSEIGKDSFGYFNGMGSWNGMMNGYGSSATNPLI